MSFAWIPPEMKMESTPALQAPVTDPDVNQPACIHAYTKLGLQTRYTVTEYT